MKIVFVFLCVLVLSCQYPVNFSLLPETHKFLVIDAEVTENFARLNVSYSLEDVSSSGAYNLPKPPQTTAYLLNGKGDRYIFKNTAGEKDTLFKGKIGETYKLFVNADGRTYESNNEIMRPTPELDSVSMIYRREVFRAPDDLFYDGFDIYTEAKDIPGVENFYQWDWIHYEKAIYCNKIYSEALKTDQLIPCFPSACWNIITNQKIIVQSDKLRDGSPLAKLVVRVPFAYPPNPYYLRIEQRAITASVYEYLKSIEVTTQQVGTLFDLPAQTRFNPNVFNTADKNEKLLGSFSVYSYRYRIININMLQAVPGATVKFLKEPLPFTDNPFLSAPCVESYSRTKIKPEGWIE